VNFPKPVVASCSCVCFKKKETVLQCVITDQFLFSIPFPKYLNSSSTKLVSHYLKFKLISCHHGLLNLNLLLPVLINTFTLLLYWFTLSDRLPSILTSATRLSYLGMNCSFEHQMRTACLFRSYFTSRISLVHYCGLLSSPH
jgi:hypothetical protein